LNKKLNMKNSDNRIALLVQPSIGSGGELVRCEVYFGVSVLAVTVSVVVVVDVGDAKDCLGSGSVLAQRLTENLELALVALDVDAEYTTALPGLSPELGECVEL